MAARKKAAKKSTKSARKTTAKAQRKKGASRSRTPAKSTAARRSAGAPKEEHYSDLRRVALTHALRRLH